MQLQIYTAHNRKYRLNKLNNRQNQSEKFIVNNRRDTPINCRIPSCLHSATWQCSPMLMSMIGGQQHPRCTQGLGVDAGKSPSTLTQSLQDLNEASSMRIESQVASSCRCFILENVTSSHERRTRHVIKDGKRYRVFPLNALLLSPADAVHMPKNLL